MTKYTYSIDEIFQDDTENPENVLMTIPPHIAEEMGWKPGDTLRIVVAEEGGVSITKVEDER